MPQTNSTALSDALAEFRVSVTVDPAGTSAAGTPVMTGGSGVAGSTLK